MNDNPNLAVVEDIENGREEFNNEIPSFNCNEHEQDKYDYTSLNQKNQSYINESLSAIAIGNTYDVSSTNMTKVDGVIDTQVFQAFSNIETKIEENKAIKLMKDITSKEIISNQFSFPVIKEPNEWNKTVMSNLITGLNTFVNSTAVKEIQEVTSYFGKWLQSIDFSPLIDALKSLSEIGINFEYKEIQEKFLQAMFDAKWFPYAGWIAEYTIVEELLDILDTTRNSKNRVKRIDKLIFSYYDTDEINSIKRRWRKMDLPSYMTRILIQSVQAYQRREYALTVSALSTLWEGIIQEKVNKNKYRASKETRQSLTKLIKQNDFDEIFSSFCEEFIFYNCTRIEEVKADVPGRHCIAHGWYNTYPNRKVALNAIIFTDFLIQLEPLEKNGG